MYKSHPLTITNLLGIPARIRLHPSRKDDVKLENVRIDEDMEVPEDKSTQQPAGYVHYFSPEAICIVTVAVRNKPMIFVSGFFL